MINLEIKERKIYLKSPFDEKIIRFCRANSGEWDRDLKVWVLDVDVLPNLQLFLLNSFDYSETEERVNIEIDLDKYFSNYEEYPSKILLGRYVIAYRPSRDRDVRYNACVLIMKGEFPSKGGSVKHPRVTWEEGTTIRVKNITKHNYNKIKDYKGVVLL